MAGLVVKTAVVSPLCGCACVNPAVKNKSDMQIGMHELCVVLKVTPGVVMESRGSESGL